MNKKIIYALGFFDGVHLGHQALLSACRQLADCHSCTPGVVTFVAHPETVILGKAPVLINSIADREHLLRQFGAETIVSLPFDDTLRAMSWRDFIHMLRCEPYNAAGFVCGEDFHFGYKGEGNANILQEYCQAAGLPCSVVPEQQLDGVRVSSTHIRTLLECGDQEEANRFLGHPHIFTGTVVAGRGLGHTIGTPTANLILPQTLIRPKLGVYACMAVLDGQAYPAVTNIGCRPTVGGHQVRGESWLLDFDGDLYGKTLTLEFYAFLRPEKKFASLEALKQEIQKNGEQTRAVFGKT